MGLSVSSAGGGLDAARAIARIIVDKNNMPIATNKGDIIVARKGS